MKLFDMLFKRKDKSEKLQVVQADEKESAEVVQQLYADKDTQMKLLIAMNLKRISRLRRNIQ